MDKVARINKKLKRAANMIADAVEIMYDAYRMAGYSHEQVQRQILLVLRSWEDEIKHEKDEMRKR